MKNIKYTVCATLFSVVSIFSQATITNTPSTRYQSMKGWGVSVAWWGNLVGGMPQASIDDICNRVAVEANLNLFRFNIGGGDNPTCRFGDHMRKDGGKMPGYRPFYANNQGFGVVDVTGDARQIRVMDKLASLRAPYGGIVTEMFSVAPPYYMTVSNCSAGAVSALNENLAPGFEDDFADYICSVTKTLRDSRPNWNIRSIEPFNEPYSNFWAAGGNQEGCKVLANQQATVLYNVWLKQQTYGIGDISLVAPDCNTVAETRQNAYDLWLNHNNEYNGLAAICTHTYAGTAQEKASLHTEISGTGKPIWQTETGPLEWILPSGGQWWWRHYDMAYRLVEDIRNLKAEVWCNWQAMSYDDGWGLVQQTNWDENNPFQTPTFKNTRSFYIMKQIANYIKVGYTQIANGDPNSMTFVSPDNSKIVVVVTNNSTTSKDYSIDLSNFQPITYFDTYRTSGGDDSGENAKLLTSPTTTQKGVFSANRIAYTAPSMSVTTFVASVEAPISVTLNDFETVAPTNVVRYGSALSILPNPLVNATNATARVARLGRTTNNWFELFAFNTSPIVVPANTTYYLHALVRYNAAADVAIRYDGANRGTDGTVTVRASNPYTTADANTWKDLVFAIPGGVTGVTVNNIQFHPDQGFDNLPAGQILNNTSNFAFIDELLISTNSTERTAVAAPTLASTLANFDGVNPVATTNSGASQAVVANPYPNGGNTSANVSRIGRTGVNWFEVTKFDIPDFTLLAGETRYIHVAVNYPASPVAVIRIDADAFFGQTDILPVNTYAAASNGHWQDLVFAVTGGPNGSTVNSLVIAADAGNFGAPPTGTVLDNTTNFAFVDNIIINNSPAPLFTARTGLQAITLYAVTNTNPLPRLVDYTNAGVTGVTAGNLVAINAAIDVANPAPTTLAQVQTVVNQTIALESLSIRLNDFETVAPNNVVRYGSALSIVPNPLVNATNATTRVARLGRTSANWFELFAFNINPITVPANTTYYLHTMVRYGAGADIAIRYDASNRDTDGITPIRALNPYTSSDSGQWKDLVFAIPGGTTGITINAIQFHPDLGFENVPAAQVLNNTTSFAFIDEFFVNGSSTARTSVAAPTLATTLANFDGISPAATTDFGATQAVVANPYPNAGNTSANVSRIGRTGVNWFEVTKFNIPDFTLLAGETRYIHVAVNYPASPVAVIRIDADLFFGQTDILPVNTYAAASNGHWQDLVFAVTGGPNGSTVNSLVIAADAGNFGTPPTGTVLNNTTNFAFVDNIIINNSPAPLFTARTGLQAVTLYAGANTNPLPRAVDYTAAGVTGVTAGNLVAVNAAIDAASPAPTTLAGVQAIVNSVNNFVWTGATSTDWSVVSNWNKGILPDLNSVVTIPSGTTFQPTIAANVAINSLTIASGASVSVTANNLTVTGAITNNGTMTLASNSNLIQSGVTNTNTGNITVTRNSNALSRLDYTIWSSPVSSQNLLAFSPATSTTRFYNYNETTNLYNAIPDPSMVSFAAATGYLIRMPNTAVTAPLTQTFAGVFTGVPNNGDITKAVSYSGSASFGFNMVGNPYPSTIDANLFLAANTANIESSLYFWRKVNAASGSAYAVYNLLGSTTTPTSAMPNGTIQVGQGFFVKAKSASTITFTNAMRISNNANQFFKIKATQKDRIWLNLTNTSGAFSQTLVGYLADATPGIDMYDAKYINDSSIALTSNINNEEYSIQGRPSFDVSDVVSLNFKTDVGGAYTIALDHFDGLFAAGQDIYLKDNVTGVETDLKAGSYSFDASAGVANGRFTLKYQKTLKVDEPSFNENSVRVYKNNGILYINSGSAVINNVKVFDIQGKLLAKQKNVKANATVIKDLKATNQVLIVKVTSEDKNEVTKKVMN